MSSEQAARIVFVAGMLEAGYVLIRGNRGGLADGDTWKSLWAIGLLTLGLAVFADFVPQVAGPFALLVLVAMIARNRDELGGVLRGERAAGVTAGVRGGLKRPYPTSTPKRQAGRPAGTIGHQ